MNRKTKWNLVGFATVMGLIVLVAAAVDTDMSRLVGQLVIFILTPCWSLDFFLDYLNDRRAPE